MPLISKEEISQIVTNKIVAGGNMFGSAALLINRFQVSNIAQAIAEEITDTELAESNMLAQGEALVQLHQEQEEELEFQEGVQLEHEKMQAAHQ